MDLPNQPMLPMDLVREITINPRETREAFETLLNLWDSSEHRVFVLKCDEPIADPKQFYTDCFAQIGTPVALAEDVNHGDRENQRTGEIWMEVRYDSSHPDAYRHSASAQPLHTDGSYISTFPNATLMTCVANSSVGGETTFISSEELVDSLKIENQHLLESLSARVTLHERSGDSRSSKVIDLDRFPTLVNWNYYCLAPLISEDERKTLLEFFEFLSTSPSIASKTVAVKLQPGDAVVWKDREVLHGRNGFSAARDSERFIWKCAIDVGKF
jgi:alpha-ketoglutarate-dependent taurine dioxygenase